LPAALPRWHPDARPFIITDAAINIAPPLDENTDIVQNAIDRAHRLGVARTARCDTVCGRDCPFADALGHSMQRCCTR
jgi:hypothetical protein